MKWRIEIPSRPIIPAPVIGSIVYYGLFWVWFIWLLCTMQYSGGSGPPVLSGFEYLCATGLNLLLIGWLSVTFARAWKRKGALRKSHLVGAGLAIVLQASMQFGLHTLHGPSPFGPVEPNSLIEAWRGELDQGKNPLNFRIR